MAQSVIVSDVQPHLWSGEELLWCERPSRVGALLANLRHSFMQANEAVDLFSGPLRLFVVLLAFSSILAVMLVPYLLLVTVGLLAVLLALGAAIAAGITPWLRRPAARAICYAITTRRVLVVRGPDVTWDVHTHWGDARVSWRAGGIGTIVFRRDRQADLEVRFTGVRNPLAVVDIARNLRKRASEPQS